MNPSNPTSGTGTGTGTGHVEETPEAGPLTPPTMQDHYAGTPPAGEGPRQAAPRAGGAFPDSPAAPQERGGGGAGGAGDAGRQAQDRAEEVGRELTERLKPVAAAAEDVAAKALDASAKGLGLLARKLEERRRRRAAGE